MPARFECVLAVLLSAAFAVAESNTGSIEGEALDRITGTPLAGVQITLLGPFPTATFSFDNRPPIPPSRIGVSTDRKGSFAFRNLPTGHYLVQAIHDRYEGATSSESRVVDELLDLTVGAQIKNVVLRLAPRGVISGRVTGGDGRPLQNARIAIYRRDPRGWTRSNQMGETGQPFLYTNDRGEYRAFGLMHGPYAVSASYPYEIARLEAAASPGHGHPTRYFGDAAGPGDAKVVFVSAGQTVRADIQIKDGPAYQIRGYVKNRDGALPGRACVGFIPRGSAPTLLLMVGSISTPESGGEFVIDAIAPGEYTLTAQECGAPQSGIAVQNIAISGSLDNLVIQLPPAIPVRGRVKVEGDVDLRNASPALWSVPLTRAFLTSIGAQDGALSFDSIPQIPVVPYFHSLPPGVYVKSIQYGGREVPADGIVPRPDALLEATLSSRGAAALRGDVVDKFGAPSKYPIVFAIPRDGGPAAAAVRKIGDAGGHFVFPSLRPGAYEIAALELAPDPPMTQFDDQYRNALSAHSATVTLAPSESFQLASKLTLTPDDDLLQAAFKK